MSEWSLPANHARVLIAVGKNPRLTQRQIADTVGISERTAQSILWALARNGLISRERRGRRNRHRLHYAPIVRKHPEGGLAILLALQRELQRHNVKLMERAAEMARLAETAAGDLPLRPHPHPMEAERTA